MKLFVLVSRVPYPLEKGDKLRIYHQLRELSQHHEIFLCCLDAERSHQASIDHLTSFCTSVKVVALSKWKIALRLPFAALSSRPIQVHYFLQRKARKQVLTFLSQSDPDHIFCQLIRCTEYVKHIHHIPKTLDYMDAFSKGMDRRSIQAPFYMKWLWRIEGKRLLRYENLIFDYFEHHTIISEQDRNLIVHPMRSKIEVVPNGVDTSFYYPSGDQEADHDLVFTGNMSYPPNIDMAEYLALEILPRVREKHPTTKLLLAGATPHLRVLKLESEAVTVTGWMDDIREAYRRGKIFVAPMRIGTGLQNKLLEAMSMELPCVTSSLANNALKARNGIEVLVADRLEDQVEAITGLLENGEQRMTLGKNGREFVQNQFSWHASGRLLTDIMSR